MRDEELRKFEGRWAVTFALPILSSKQGKNVLLLCNFTLCEPRSGSGYIAVEEPYDYHCGDIDRLGLIVYEASMYHVRVFVVEKT